MVSTRNASSTSPGQSTGTTQKARRPGLETQASGSPMPGVGRGWPMLTDWPKANKASRSGARSRLTGWARSGGGELGVALASSVGVSAFGASFRVCGWFRGRGCGVLPLSAVRLAVDAGPAARAPPVDPSNCSSRALIRN